MAPPNRRTDSEAKSNADDGYRRGSRASQHARILATIACDEKLHSQIPRTKKAWTSDARLTEVPPTDSLRAFTQPGGSYGKEDDRPRSSLFSSAPVSAEKGSRPKRRSNAGFGSFTGTNNCSKSLGVMIPVRAAHIASSRTAACSPASFDGSDRHYFFQGVAFGAAIVGTQPEAVGFGHGVCWHPRGGCAPNPRALPTLHSVRTTEYPSQQYRSFRR